MLKSNAFVWIVAGFMLFCTISLAYAQNGTVDTNPNDDASLGGQIAITMGLVGTIILTILGIVKQLVDKGFFDKKVGTAAVMGADATVAVLQTRELLAESVDTIVSTIAIDNPTLAAKIQDALKPLLRKIDMKVTEYQPKADKFSEIASKIGDKGENTVDAMKDDQKLKENIPNEIVPTDAPEPS